MLQVQRIWSFAKDCPTSKIKKGTDQIQQDV